MDPRAEAERWLGTAAKLLTARDFVGSKTFAIRAKEADPNNAVPDQILAVVDTVLAGEKRVNSNQQPDWYAVLQLPRLVRDSELIADHYRRLVYLLNPDHNRLPFADYALQLAMDAWSVLSDPTKKWLFDNELALYIQRSEPARVDPFRPDPVRVDPVQADSSGPSVAASSSSAQLNTFQFFQPQPPPSQPSAPPPMWQQQPQREFMPPPSQPPPPPPPPASGPPQQLPPQWQMRDPTPAKGGERNKGSMNGIGGSKGRAQATSMAAPNRAAPPPVATTTTAQATPQPPPPPVAPSQPPPPARVRTTVTTTTTVVDGNASNNNTTNSSNANAAANENNADVVEDVESFWTACPYCLYIYAYQKIYQDCTLRCQNCRRGFHAVQIPNPPPIAPGKSGGGKDCESTFCCWGFFPLGFSMEAWKKYNQIRTRNGSNWVPFSPMFTSPVENNGGGNFQCFPTGGSAVVGPKKNVVNAPAPRVYIDDEDDDFIEFSDADSSDHDWRNTKKDKKKKKGWGGKRGRPRKVSRLNHGNENENVVTEGEVSIVNDDLENGSEAQEVVVGLVAGTKVDASKNVAASKNVTATNTRKQTRRSAKDVGRLDLNVEFNNEVDDHAPTASAVNVGEDGIETIGFFEGLDEFLSTLPILNVGGDEKAKPS